MSEGAYQDEALERSQENHAAAQPRGGQHSQQGATSANDDQPRSSNSGSQPNNNTSSTERSNRTQQQQQPSAAHPPRPRQQRTREDPSNRLMQPHGAAVIGPTGSNVSNSTSLQQVNQAMVSIESPLPPVVQRSLGDRSNEKRKNAALEIEALVKSLSEANNMGMIQSIIAVLSKDFCTSMNANYRKGGLVGLAATAIGLMNYSSHYLKILLPPILHCFDDP